MAQYAITQSIMAGFYDFRLGNWTEAQRKEYEFLYNSVLETNEKIFNFFLENCGNNNKEEQTQFYESLLSDSQRCEDCGEILESEE